MKRITMILSVVIWVALIVATAYAAVVLPGMRGVMP